MSTRKTPLFIFINIFISIVLIVIIVQISTHRLKLHDLKVYYEAAKDLLSGGAVYDKYYGLASGYYKYTPCLLLFFALLVWTPWKTLLLIYPTFILFFVFAPFVLKLKKILMDPAVKNNVSLTKHKF